MNQGRARESTAPLPGTEPSFETENSTARMNNPWRLIRNEKGFTALGKWIIGASCITSLWFGFNNTIDAVKDGLRESGAALTQEKAEVIQVDEKEVVYFDGFGQTPLLRAQVLASPTVKISYGFKEQTIPTTVTPITPNGNFKTPEIDVYSLVMQKNPPVKDKKTDQLLPRSLANVLIMYPDDAFSLEFNKSAYERNTEKIANGNTTNELEKVVTANFNAEDFTAVLLQAETDNVNLYRIISRSHFAAGQAIADTISTIGILPKEVRDFLSGGSATFSEQSEQTARNMLSNAEREYAIKECAQDLIKTTQNQTTNESTQGEVAQAVTYIINAKVASMINNVRKAEHPEDRLLTPEEIGSVVSGSFSSIKEDESETSAAKSIDDTDPVESLAGGVIKTNHVAGMEQKQCVIDPLGVIEKDKTELQADINELARSVKP